MSRLYRFCPICGSAHDPEIPCSDRSKQMGIPTRIHKTRRFKNILKQSNRRMVIVLVIILFLSFLTGIIKLIWDIIK